MASVRYINRRGDGCTETVEEHDYPMTKADRLFLKENLRDLRVADPGAEYWISPRCCKNWTERWAGTQA